MRIVDRYILTQWVASLGLMLVVAVGLLILEDLYRNFGLFVERGVGLEQVARYFAYRLPGFLPVILPLALLLSLLYSLRQWQRNNEMTALRCAGLGLWRITWIFWAMGGVISVLLVVLNAEVIPRTENQADDILLRLRVEGQAEGQWDQHLTLHNRQEHRFWMIDVFDRSSGEVTGISIQEVRPGEEVRVIHARGGRYRAGEGVWELEGVRVGRVDARTGEIADPETHQSLLWAAPGESPELMRLLARRPKDLSLLELEEVRRFLRAVGDPQVTRFDVHYHSIWAETLRALIVVAIAIPFTVRGVRRNAMKGIAKSIGLFLLFFLLENLFMFLGERRILPPPLAVWSPSVLMLAIGLWFFHRANYPD